MKSFRFFLLLPLLAACGVLGMDDLPNATQPAPVVLPTTEPMQEEASADAPTANPVNPVIHPSATPPAASFPDPESYTWRQIVSGLDKPLGLTHAGDERLFILEQPGLIRILREGQLLPVPFLDIRSLVQDDASERGLLGLAFHPQFAQNGFFYVNYTGRGGETIIARFRVEENPDLADPESEQILMRIAQPYANHNGGGLAFGPDGRLYIGTGDGGSGGDPQGNAQDPNSLLGKMLRIDVDQGNPYAIPGDNPFSQGGGALEVWALGLRNPWRFSFDQANGDLTIADVGQDQWEEVNILSASTPPGVNFGWNLREGRHNFAGEGSQALLDPVAEYDHSQGCSITGGHVVRGEVLPEWNGVYLFGDFCRGTIWGLLQGPDGSWQMNTLFQMEFQISSFGEDSLGGVYVVDYNGALYQLEAKP